MINKLSLQESELEYSSLLLSQIQQELSIFLNVGNHSDIMRLIYGIDISGISYESLNIETIKKSKSYLFLVMQRLKRYIASVSKGLKTKQPQVARLSKGQLKEKINEDVSIRMPKYDIFKKMHTSVGNILQLSKDLEYGSKTIKSIPTIINYSKDKKESSLRSLLVDYQKLAKSRLNNDIIDSIGLRLETDSKDIFSKGFRVIHKQPEWEANLQSTKLKDLGYNYEEFLKLCRDSYTKDNVVDHLDTLHKNVVKLETLFFKSSNELEKEYEKENDDIFLKGIHGLLSVFYITEIMDHKCHMWLNKLWKYELVLLKKIT